MKTILYLLLFMNGLLGFSQQRAIEITNIKTGKTLVYQEKQRVKVRTLDRKKHLGRIHFSDQNTLLIGHESIPIDSILSIKRQSLVVGGIKTTMLSLGLTIILSSLNKASSGNDSAINLFLIGAGTGIGSGIIESINYNHKNKKWTFKIIEK